MRGRSPMRCLITGGAGFIGSHLVEHPVGAGHDVVVLADLSTGRRENFAAVRRRISFMRGSVADLSTCRRAMEGVDYVLHHAAVTSVQRSVDDAGAAHTVNATGTLNVLLAARDARVRRVVYAGSTSAYGGSTVLPNSEDHVAHPLGPYAAAKLAGEGYCLAFHATYGLETVVLRYFNVFGPRQDPDSPYAAVVPRFILAALQGEPPLIFGDGEQTRDFTHVANVVQANMLACTAPAERVAGEVYNIGCGGSVTINEVWDRSQQGLGILLPARHAPARAGEVRDSQAGIEKAARELGYRPSVDFGAGLRLTVAAYARRCQPEVATSQVRVSGGRRPSVTPRDAA